MLPSMRVRVSGLPGLSGLKPQSRHSRLIMNRNPIKDQKVRRQIQLAVSGRRIWVWTHPVLHRSWAARSCDASTWWITTNLISRRNAEEEQEEEDRGRWRDRGRIKGEGGGGRNQKPAPSVSLSQTTHTSSQKSSGASRFKLHPVTTILLLLLLIPPRRLNNSNHHHRRRHQRINFSSSQSSEGSGSHLSRWKVCGFFPFLFFCK